MKRYVVATAVLAMVMTLGSSGTAGAAGRRHIRPGGVWTITVGSQCEVQTFAVGHAWTSDRFSDSGTYTGGSGTFKETFLTGGDLGSTFKATWSKTNHDYEGTFTDATATSGPAVLTKGVNCPPPV